LVLAGLAVTFGAGAQRLLSLVRSEAEVVHAFGVSRERFASGAVWTLVTAGFLHLGLAHALSNAAFALVIGVVLFGTHGVGASAASWLFASMVGLSAEVAASGSGALVAGASAGNYGLVGLWAHGQLERSRRALLPRRERLRTLGILLVLVPGAFTPVTASGGRVAVLAHAAGFVAGFMSGAAFHRRLDPGDFSRIGRRSSIGGIAAVLVTLIAALLSLLLSGCGYVLGPGRTPGGVRAVAVQKIDEPGLDLDAAALVAESVRRAVARGPSTELAPAGSAEATMEIRLLESSSGLVPLADPATRAAQYRAIIRLSAVLTKSDGHILWRSSVVTGEAPYLSMPGKLEALDGARRRALAQAADDAAAKLLALMVYGS
jgi:membrane associated rhomboid family serine protease